MIRTRCIEKLVLAQYNAVYLSSTRMLHVFTVKFQDEDTRINYPDNPYLIYQAEL